MRRYRITPKYVEMINLFCIDDHGLLKPLSHANADLNAYHAVTSLCQTHEVPMRVLHAQFLGFKVESLNKTPAWSAILKAPLSNIELRRTQTSVNLGLAARLTAQIEAKILHIHDETYRNEVLLPRYRTLLDMSAPNDYTSSIDEEAQIVAKLPWAADSMRVEHYTRENTAWASSTRREAVVHNTRNPCNQSIAGVNGTLVDGPKPRHQFYLPVCVDHAAISERSQDPEKVGKMFVDFEKPTTHVAMCGTEEGLVASVEEIVDYLTAEGDTDTLADGTGYTKKSRVVDEPLARQIQSFIASQGYATSGLLTHLGPEPSPNRQWAEDVLGASNSGPIIEAANFVLQRSAGW